MGDTTENNNPSGRKRKAEDSIVLDKDVLQCPVCLDVPRGKIFSCLKVHHICEPCYDKGKVKSANEGTSHLCPVGRCAYPHETRRIWIAEQVVANSGYKFECTHAAMGCKEKRPSNQLEAHEKECRFKKRTCPRQHLDHCKGHVSRATFFTHFSAEHKNWILTAAGGNLTFSVRDANLASGVGALMWGPYMMKLADPRGAPGVLLNVMASFQIANQTGIAFAMVDKKNASYGDLKIQIELKCASVRQLYQGPLLDFDDHNMLVNGDQLAMVLSVGVMKKARDCKRLLPLTFKLIQ